jgi:hypothetical protein
MIALLSLNQRTRSSRSDFQYYPAVILNIMYDTQKCAVMFEGYDTQEIVQFDDVEPFEASFLSVEKYQPDLSNRLSSRKDIMKKKDTNKNNIHQ